MRGVVLDAEGRVFLIKHTYAEGWHLPGGGVEAGETLIEALTRELAEEGNIEMTGPPVLHGIYFHPVYSRRDHVTVYVVRDFRQTAPPEPNREIAAHGFFPARCVAARHHRWHPRPHRRGTRRHACRGALVAPAEPCRGTGRPV